MAISHQHFVERYKSTETKKIIDYLKKSERAIKNKILSYGDGWVATKKKQQQLLTDIKKIQQVYNDKIKRDLENDLKLFSTSESKTLNNQLKNAIPDEISSVYSGLSVSPEKIYAIIKPIPLMLENGTTLTIDEFIETFNTVNIQKIVQVINQGIILNETPKKITDRLNKTGLYNGRQKNASTLVRTLLNGVQSNTRMELYRENDDIIDGYQWVSTLDKKTSGICIERDGRVWIYDEKKREKYDNLLPNAVYPPAHYGCRSVTVPVLKSFRDLGYNVDDLQAGTRASMDGYVSESTNYSDWIAKQPYSVQVDVLGKTRADLLQSGVANVTDFFDDQGMITLHELGQAGIDIPKRYK